MTHKLVITDIKQGVRNPNRANIYLDGKYVFSLDISQVVDFGVKIGRVLTEEELVELKRASEFGKLYQRTLEWVLVRPRSEKETRDYLRRKLAMSSSGRSSRPSSRGSSLSPRSNCGSPSEDIVKFSGEVIPRSVSRGRSLDDISELSSEVIRRLVSRGYVDDRKFAEYYVENRFVKKGVSVKRLKMELMKKGVSKEIIEEVLAGSERNDEEEIQKIIARKRAKYTDDKLIAYLCRQGFSYDLVRKIVTKSEF